MSGRVEFRNVGKKYVEGESFSVKNVDLNIEKGQFVVIVGPSGCGKSTTLRMLAGLESVSEGEILIDDIVINNVPPKDRDIAMVFQNYALYPHMTVRQNISYGLKVRKTPKNEIEEKVKWAAEMLGLEEYLDRKPRDLSGGQRQRIALGRAMVRSPKVFLMDEPLSNLDAKLRVNMRNEIIKLHRSLETTTVYVTHDQVEAMTMADVIVLMDEGKVQQTGTPIELFDTPNNLFVASFLGAPQMNFLDVNVLDDKLIIENLMEIDIPPKFKEKLVNNNNYILGIRPSHIKTTPLETQTYSKNVCSINIEHVENMGTENYIYSRINDKRIIVKTTGPIKTGTLDIVIAPDKIHLFDIETKNNILL